MVGHDGLLHLQALLLFLLCKSQLVCSICECDGVPASGLSNGGQHAAFSADTPAAGSPGVLIGLPSRGPNPVLVRVEVGRALRQLKLHITCKDPCRAALMKQTVLQWLSLVIIAVKKACCKYYTHLVDACDQSNCLCCAHESDSSGHYPAKDMPLCKLHSTLSQCCMT